VVTNQGRFLVIEGMEGAGKSTVLQTVEQYLLPHVPELVLTREPGGTEAGERIRSLLQQVSDEPLDARAELLLFYAARVQLVERVIRPALARGAWVLADRFELSSFAYQGGGRQLDRQFIQQLSHFCLHGLRPDLTLFLDISPETGLQRVVLRGKKDRIEQESVNFFQTVSKQYQREIAQGYAVEMIDANQSIAAVQSQIIGILAEYVQQYA